MTENKCIYRAGGHSKGGSLAMYVSVEQRESFLSAPVPTLLISVPAYVLVIYALAAYYILPALMRASLLHYVRKDEKARFLNGADTVYAELSCCL